MLRHDHSVSIRIFNFKWNHAALSHSLATSPLFEVMFGWRNKGSPLALVRKVVHTTHKTKKMGRRVSIDEPPEVPGGGGQKPVRVFAFFGKAVPSIGFR